MLFNIGLIVLLELLEIKIILMLVLKSLEFDGEFEISGKFWFFAIFLPSIVRERERDWCFYCCNSSASCDDKNRYKSPVEYWIFTLYLVLVFGAVITWNDTVVTELCLSYVASDLIFWVIAAMFTSIFGLIANRIGHEWINNYVRHYIFSCTYLDIFYHFKQIL